MDYYTRGLIMDDLWDHATLKKVLQVMHCLTDGHYEDLPEAKKCTVDLDVSRILAQFETLIQRCEHLEDTYASERNYRYQLENTLIHLIETKFNSELIPGMPTNESLERDAWKAAKDLVTRIKNGKCPE